MSFSVLKTFVYDPLVEWTERRHRDTAATAAKEEVRRILLNSETKLTLFILDSSIRSKLFFLEIQ